MDSHADKQPDTDEVQMSSRCVWNPVSPQMNSRQGYSPARDKRVTEYAKNQLHANEGADEEEESQEEEEEDDEEETEEAQEFKRLCKEAAEKRRADERELAERRIPSTVTRQWKRPEARPGQ